MKKISIYLLLVSCYLAVGIRATAQTTPPTFLLQGDTTLSVCEGILLDNGGTGNYLVDYNSSLIINPPTATCIELTIDSLDFGIAAQLIIRDGNYRTIAELYGNSHFTTPQHFVAQNGKMYLDFYAAPYDTARAGFRAHWNCRADCVAAAPCSASLYDTGGIGTGYAPNESYTTTYTPPSPDHRMSIQLRNIDIKQGDQLCVYDGNSTAAPLLRCIDSSTVVGAAATITASLNNRQGGCLTMRFTSDSTIQGAGWRGNLVCVRTCQTIIATLLPATASIAPAHTPLIAAGDSAINICVGTALSIAATALYPENDLHYHQNDSTTVFTFHWGDGDSTNAVAGSLHTATHTFMHGGIFFVRVSAADADGDCRSNSSNNFLRVRVIDVPILPTTSDIAGCQGSSVLLHKLIPNPNIVVSDAAIHTQHPSCILDDINAPLISPLSIQLPNNPLITPTCGIKAIHIKIEHSFSTDLRIKLVSPTGDSVLLKDSWSGINGYLGIANRFASTCPETAEGFTYSFTNHNPMFNMTTLNQGSIYSQNNPYSGVQNTKTPGSYLPEEALSGTNALLNGKIINGTWQLFVQDRTLLDNGILYDWAIEFDTCLVQPEQLILPPIAAQWLPDANLAINTPIATGNFTNYVATIASQPIGMPHSYYFEAVQSGTPTCIFRDTVRVNYLSSPTLPTSFHDTTITAGSPVILDATPPTNCPIQAFVTNTHLNIDQLSHVIESSTVEVTRPCGSLVSVCTNFLATTPLMTGLDMWLVAPSGDSVLLASNSTISSGFQCFAMVGMPLGTDLNGIPFGAASAYIPFQSLNLIHGPVQGTWRLNIRDNYYDGGVSIGQYLDSWRIYTGENIPFAYYWSFPNPISDSDYRSTYTVNPTTTTTYTVAVYGQTGCAIRDTITIFVVAGTQDIATLKDWRVQPNPASNSLQVDADFDTPTNGTVTIENSLGQTLFTQPFAPKTTLQTTIDIQDYPAGCYFLRLKTRDGTATKKIIKQ